MLSVSVGADPLIEGRVRLDSGEPVADAQVRIFDMTDLQRGAIARATTDGTGYFALPLASLTGSVLPTSFTLGQNYPNPFNPSTIIPYQLATSSAVRLEVFNLLGQHIATLVDGERPAGFHTATWHAVDGAGRAVGAGVYIYRMTVSVESQTGRMVLLDGQAGVSAGGVASVMPGASGVSGSDGEGAQVYGLIVSGSGLAPYVDSSFRVKAGMAPVELVVSSGPHSAGKITDDDCDFCDLFYSFNDAKYEEEQEETDEVQEEEGDETPEVATSGSGNWRVGAIRRLTDSPAYESSPSWSPDGRHIAFTSQRYGNREIHVMDSDGSNPRRLINGNSPSWSPDGRHIAFESSLGIHVMGSDGSNPRRLTDSPAYDYQPSWSPDGQHIAFESNRDGNREIYVMDSDGSNPRRLTHHPDQDSSPSWSPDGRHIAFESSLGIHVMGSDGSNPRRLTDSPAYDYQPSWSPDGQHIAFESNRDGNREIYVMDSDGSNPRRLTHHPDQDSSPSWSPDGRHIAFESSLGIHVMGSDGSNPRRLTYRPDQDSSPSWSPDGQHIAFLSSRDGNREIYVMGSDRSNPRRLTYHPDQDSSPSWSPDGRHIAFLSSRDGNREIYAMEVEEGGSNTPVSVGSSTSGLLSAGDRDYFRVTVNSLSALTIYTTGSTNTYGYVEDGSGKTLNENDDGGEGNNFRMPVVVAPGTYYIGVLGFDASTTGSYTLHVQKEALEPPTLVAQHDDRVVVMSIPSRLTIDPIDFDALAQVFFDHYEDAFDYLMVFSNLQSVQDNQYYTYVGFHMSVQNIVQGTGKRLHSRNQAVGSAGKLNAILHFPYNGALLFGPSLHEIMHSWANFAIPTAVNAHWGFSSANGQLGGFNRTDLIEHGGGQYSAGAFGTFANGGNSLPYSPIELYFAGLIPPSEVPDLWVAEDGAWSDDRDDSGVRIFTASQVSTWSIDRIVVAHGARLPASSQSQKHFRAALILLVDQQHPALQGILDRLSAEVQQFTHTGNDSELSFNFWEATGGRATLTMDGLSAYRKSSGAGKQAVSYRIVEPVAGDGGQIGCVSIDDAAKARKWMVWSSD